MRKTYHQLTHDDRVQLETLLRAGHDKKEVSQLMGIHISTVYREYKRGSCIQLDTQLRTYTVYSVQVAEDRRRAAFAHKGAPVKLDTHQSLIPLVEDLIVDQRYSPGAASAVLRRQQGPFLSEATIYRYISERRFPHLRRKHLPEKGIRKHPYQSVERIYKKQLGASIEKRPAEVAERCSAGHWEFDSIIGKSSGQGESCLVFTERFSRLELVFKVPRKTAACTVETLDRLQKQCAFSKLFRSITMDNGSEFADSKRIEFSQHGRRRTHAYYCHPYTSCERGSNENANRLLRRWLPKKKSLKNVTQAQALALTRWMNNYPRESLGWKTPAEVFLEACRQQHIPISKKFSQYLS